MEEQLFSQQQKPLPQNPVGEISSVATRLKLAEERYANLQKRNQITEENLLQFEKEMKTEVRVLTQKTVEMKRRIEEINSKVDTILGELDSVVQRHEFQVVEKYLDLWQPMRFVTREEAKRLIQETIVRSERG